MMLGGKRILPGMASANEKEPDVLPQTVHALRIENSGGGGPSSPAAESPVHTIKSLSLPRDSEKRPMLNDAEGSGIGVHAAVGGNTEGKWDAVTLKPLGALARFKTMASAHPALQGINLDHLPVGIRAKIEQLDTNGDGQIDVEELIAAVAKMKKEDMKYSIDSFPEAIREDLACFDLDGDGTVSAEEVARACEMYKNAQRKLRVASKTVLGLLSLMFCALALNAGLTVAIANLTQDYKLGGDGVMRDRSSGSVVSTGKVTDAVSFIADRDCYRRMRGRDGPDSPDLLAMKPEMLMVVLTDPESLHDNHNVTLPIDFMRIENDSAKLGNTQLGYSVMLKSGETPKMSFNSWSSNPESSFSTEEESKILAKVVTMITVYRSKEEMKTYGGDLGQFTQSRADLLLTVKESGNADAHRLEPFREVDATQANKVARDVLRQLAVEDANSDVKTNPKSNIARGEPDSWMVLLSAQAANSTFDDDLFHEFCNSLIVQYHGTCTCRNAELSLCARDEAVAFNQFEISIPEHELTALLQHPHMEARDNKFGITQISKIFLAGGPSVERWGFHTSVVDSEHEERVQKHVHRRRQLREAVFSTPKGRKLHASLREHALVEDLRARMKTVEMGNFLGYHRDLKQVDERAEEKEDLKWLMEKMERVSDSCYFSSKIYRGSQRTVTVVGEFGLISSGTCLAWTPEEIAIHNITFLPEDCASPSVDAYRVNPECAVCRHIAGEEVPHCPYAYGPNSERQLVPCNIPHCMEKLQNVDPRSPPLESPDDQPWGLNRIRHSRAVDSYNVDYDPVEDDDALNGRGVHCYIVDSGVNLDHAEFAGKPWLQRSIRFSGIDRSETANDDNGHGTHIAGIVAGKTVGVAPGCTIHAIKVLNRKNRAVRSQYGSSVFLGLQKVLSHFEWVKEQRARLNLPPPKAVVNLSIRSPKSQIWESAVNRLHAAGVVVVSAAGNNDDDACNHSPATQERALTVGATTMDDSKAIYSNYGSCVQIYAPGTGIRSASHEDRNGYVYMSGTSMAAPFVTGAVALFLQAHPSATANSAARFILNLASSGLVHGVDTKLPTYANFGYHSQHWEKFKRWAEGRGYNAEDESRNVDFYDNKLLFIDRNNFGLGGDTLDVCADDDESQWGEWDVTNATCPVATTLCGSSSVSIGPPWVEQAVTMPAPVLKRTRKCVATSCICKEDFQHGVLSCDPDGSRYHFVEGCGLSAAVINSRQHVDWLQNMWLRFKPQDQTGMFYDVCQVDNEQRPMESSCQITEGVRSVTHLLNAGIVGAGKSSLAGTFHFWDVREGRMVPYDKVYFYANGHISFVPPTGNSAFVPMNDTYSLHTHFAPPKGAGISALFHPMSFYDCERTGASECGELRMFHDHDNKRFILTYLNVISAFAPFDQPEYRSTFQVVLWLDGSEHLPGTFDLIYYKVSHLAQGNAVYGIANGEPYRPAFVISPRDSGSQTCKAQMINMPGRW